MAQKSPTWDLVDKIETLTGHGWDQGKRAAVADLIREYRFEYVSFEKERILKLIRESGHDDLSKKVHSGQY